MRTTCTGHNWLVGVILYKMCRYSRMLTRKFTREWNSFIRLWSMQGSRRNSWASKHWRVHSWMSLRWCWLIYIVSGFACIKHKPEELIRARLILELDIDHTAKDSWDIWLAAAWERMAIQVSNRWNKSTKSYSITGSSSWWDCQSITPSHPSSKTISSCGTHKLNPCKRHFQWQSPNLKCTDLTCSWLSGRLAGLHPCRFRWALGSSRLLWWSRKAKCQKRESCIGRQRWMLSLRSISLSR